MSTTTRHTPTQSPRGLTGTLGPIAIIFMVVAAASPLTVLGGGAPLGIALGNGAGYPSIYAIATIVLLLFAVGLTAMSRRVDRPGAFYTYIGHGLGNHAGVGAAWLALLCYTMVQVAVYAYMGVILAQTLEGLTGAAVPWWLFTLASIGAVALLGYRHIDLSSKVLGVLLIGEIVIVLAIVVAVLVMGAPEGLSLTPFAPAEMISGAPGVGLMFATAAFIGFEATAVYRDEAREPSKTIPRATYGALIGIGVFYTVGSWGLVMAWGPEGVVEAATNDPSGLILTTALNYLGPIGLVSMNVLLITSMFACVLSFHNVVTRYQLSMANSGLLPASLGRVHPKHLSPHVSSLTQTVTAALIIVASAVGGLDPMLHIFTWYSGVATVAVILLMLVTGIAVMVYFRRHREQDSRTWNTVVAPVLGTIGLTLFVVVVVAYFPILVGDVNAAGEPTFGAASAILLALCVLVPVLGVVQAEWIRRQDSARFAGLLDSLAADAVAGGATLAQVTESPLPTAEAPAQITDAPVQLTEAPAHLTDTPTDRSTS